MKSVAKGASGKSPSELACETSEETSRWDPREGGSGAGRHLFSGASYSFFAEGIMLLARFVTAVFLARVLGPTSFGLFMLAATVVIWLEWSITAAFAGATLKFVGETLQWMSSYD